MAILEIGLKVGVIPLTFHLTHFSDHLSEIILLTKKPLPDLYLLYFVQNFANITAFDWFQDVK